MTDAKAIPDADLPFGKFKLLSKFKISFGMRLSKLLKDEDLLDDKHKLKVNFKDRLQRFLIEMISQVIPGDSKWLKGVSSEMSENCFMMVSAMNSCPKSDEIALAMREENMKDFIYHYILLKLFDFDKGIIPPLFGARPFGGA